MMGNLNEYYLLRQDRIRRIEEAFEGGRITAHERTKLLEQEGFGYIDSTFRPIGEAVNRVMDRIKP